MVLNQKMGRPLREVSWTADKLESKHHGDLHVFPNTQKDSTNTLD